MATETQVAFKGTAAQQELAQAAFEAMKRKGFLFGAGAPIRMGLDALAAALTKAGGPLSGQDPSKLKPDLEVALALNPDVFAREGSEYITTKSGHAPAGGRGDNTHTFKDRLNLGAQQLDAEGAAQYRASVVDLSVTRDEKTFAIEDMEEEEAALHPPPAPQPHHHARSHHPMPELRSIAASIIPAEEIPPEWLPPVLEPEPEPEFVPAPVVAIAPAPAEAPVAPATPKPKRAAKPAAVIPIKEGEEEAAVATPAAPVPATPAPQPETVEAGPASTPASTPAPVAEPTEASAPIAATPAPVAQPTPVAPVQAQAPAPTPPQVKRPAATTPPPAPVIKGPVEIAIPTSDGSITVDLREPVDIILIDDRVADALTALVEQAIENETRIVRFGSELFAEEAIERFSKGDYRRIKEYLEEPETGGLASDRDIMADVFNRRTDYPDYERLRFSINYRMLKEKKDFEFVGIDSDRLWVSAGTSPVTPPVRKPAEIGQDYRFLEDSLIETDEKGAHGPLQHSLTYYEYEQGVLPYDNLFRGIFPGALFEDQRASLIRFEIPLLYGAVIAEVRYPTGNRGGFIMGLRELFAEHMVPGAFFTITPTDRGEDVFEIHFDRADEREENVLQLDERRGRYVFRPVSFAIETNPDLLLTQEKFGKLHNQKKLEEAERKRPETVLVTAFEAVGEENDGKLWATLDDIYAVANIERPISRAWLRHLLSGSPYPYFYPDESIEGAYFYEAEKKG